MNEPHVHLTDNISFHSHTCWWNNEVLKPIQHNGYVGEGRVAMEKLGKLLDKMMLRRTKVQCADDLGLPPRKVVVRRDYFSAEEEEVYRSLFSDSARQFSAYVEQGMYFVLGLFSTCTDG